VNIIAGLGTSGNGKIAQTDAVVVKATQEAQRSNAATQQRQSTATQRTGSERAPAQRTMFAARGNMNIITAVAIRPFPLSGNARRAAPAGQRRAECVGSTDETCRAAARCQQAAMRVVYSNASREASPLDVTHQCGVIQTVPTEWERRCDDFRAAEGAASRFAAHLATLRRHDERTCSSVVQNYTERRHPRILDRAPARPTDRFWHHAVPRNSGSCNRIDANHRFCGCIVVHVQRTRICGHSLQPTRPLQGHAAWAACFLVRKAGFGSSTRQKAAFSGRACSVPSQIEQK